MKSKLKNKLRRLIYRVIGINNPYSKVEDEYKMIFIHIPKAAGNGLLKSLFGVGGTGHQLLDEYYEYDRTKFKSYYKFTVVRNPYDRFISAFYYLKKGGISINDISEMKPILSKCKDINDFVFHLKGDPKFRVNVLNYVHFIPQTHFLYAKKYRWLKSIDHIGKVEDLESTYKHLNKIFNLNSTALEIYNKTDNYNNNLNIESKEFIYSYYKDDFKNLGYDK